MSTTRVHYIDWLRVAAVLLLFPFHAGRVYNAGELFYAKSPIVSAAVSNVLWFIDFWHMPLLFLLAGASTFFALRHRSTWQFLKERSLRLLVPLVFGVLVIVPPQTWYGARTNDRYTGSLLEYFASGRAMDPTNMLGRGDYYGGVTPAHLWFIMFLWMLCILALPLLAWGRSTTGDRLLSRAARALSRPWWWIPVILATWITEGLPDIGVSNPLYYFTFFVVGYIIMHDEAYVAKAERFRIPLLSVGLSILLLAMAFADFKDGLPDPSWLLALWMWTVFGGIWMTLAGLIGFGRRHLDFTSPTLAYLAEASYPVYILHQTVIVALGFYLVRAIATPWLGWPVLMVSSAVVTFAFYEGVRRVPPLRFLFGMKPGRRTA